MRRIYLDNNATTPPLPAVVQAMTQVLGERFGNPSSLHAQGREARAALEAARAEVAHLIGATPDEIVFTSGGTEGDNLALSGTAATGSHVITSAIEHHAVLHTLRRSESAGAHVRRLLPDRRGRVDPNDVRAALTPATRLISIMMANNETGVLQPVEEIGAIAAEAGVAFHIDAVQAAGKVPIDVRRLRCDLLSISAHKMHGPQGAGALFVRAGILVRPILHGGQQERGRRAGTENLPGVAGLSAAAEHAISWLAERRDRELAALRDRLEQGICAAVPAVRVNGGEAPRVPNTSNLSFQGISGRSLVVALDDEGICVSTGSACSSGSTEAPHVLLAMGLSPAEAQASVRISLGKQTTAADVEFVLDRLPAAVARLRALSPLWPPGAGRTRSG
jgi:cysteine desulfurase